MTSQAPPEAKVPSWAETVLWVAVVVVAIGAGFHFLKSGVSSKFAEIKSKKPTLTNPPSQTNPQGQVNTTAKTSPSPTTGQRTQRQTSLNTSYNNVVPKAEILKLVGPLPTFYKFSGPPRASTPQPSLKGIQFAVTDTSKENRRIQVQTLPASEFLKKYDKVFSSFKKHRKLTPVSPGSPFRRQTLRGTIGGVKKHPMMIEVLHIPNTPGKKYVSAAKLYVLYDGFGMVASASLTEDTEKAAIKKAKSLAGSLIKWTKKSRFSKGVIPLPVL